MTEDTPDDPARESGKVPHETVLHTLARRTGRIPRVSLSDAGSGEGAPLIDPRSRALQGELSPPDQGKYRILGEIARGGMGVVLRSHDVELGREVAMKVLGSDLAARPEVVERFVEEAQVGGQLQHPGIVPVYELGLMADERPYFTMKLIKGRTLAAQLARRAAVGDERARFLHVFDSVCQTMAYAHSKGVIHRDLKPANIMVGAFGEVQVVDWGLSKVLRRGGVDDEVAHRDGALTVIETVRSGPRSGSDSLAGNVLGTPAYMSPEQAQGAIAKLDERTDVFALGAILCEILTGAPPYVGAEGESLVQKAAFAELDDARARVEGSSASAELKSLCVKCLMPAREARPRDAEEVAAAVRAHLSGLEEQAQQERLRAERSRRHVQVIGLVGALVLVAGGGGWWIREGERARRTELAQGFEGVQAEVLGYERAGELDRALDAARNGVRLADSSDAEEPLRARAAELLRTTETRWREQADRRAAAQREETLLRDLDETQARYLLNGSAAAIARIDAEYAAEYAAFGIDLAAPDLGERLARHRGSPLGIRLALGMDTWAASLRIRQRELGPSARDAQDEQQFRVELLSGLGLDLDPNPTRSRVRMALVSDDVDTLRALAGTVTAEDLEPETGFLLGTALFELGATDEGLRVLTANAERHPSSYLACYAAGHFLLAVEHPRAAEPYLQAAVALRPDLPSAHYRLGEARSWSGDSAAAGQAMARARELDPERDWDLWQIGLEFAKTGAYDRANAYLAESLVGVDETLPENFNRCDLQRFVWARQGELALEEYFAWVEAHALRSDTKWFRALLLVSFVPPAGVEPAPQRVLDVLMPYRNVSDVDVQLAIGASQVLVGDGAGALDSAERLLRISAPDRFYEIFALLLSAAGEALRGNDAEAALFLNRARAVRDELYGPRKDLWADGPIERAFAWLEPIAAGG